MVLPSGLAAQVEQAARERETTVSELVRSILRERLAERQGEGERP